jgi:hypothetical protein
MRGVLVAWLWRVVITLFLLNCAAHNAAALQTPQGAVLFITDGLGSYYVYPELEAHAQDGALLEREGLFSNITGGDVRVLHVKVAVPRTGAAHSAIITGSSRADVGDVPEKVTVFDVLREEGFLVLGVMEKGDSSSMKAELDAILYAESNSVLHPVFRVQNNSAPEGVVRVMEELSEIPAYLNRSKGAERYRMYNRFVITTTEALIEHMLEEYPAKRFLVIVNAGGLDSAGHYTNYTVYQEVIRGLDADLFGLEEFCRDNNIAFVFTADHGMCFKSSDSRGGHAGAGYSGCPESLYVPLVISASNVHHSVLKGDHAQRDVAPTLLSILDVPDMLEGDGRALPVKTYSSLYVTTDADYVHLYKGGMLVDNQSGGRVVFRGLKGAYVLRLFKDGKVKEQSLSLEGDQTLDLSFSDALFWDFNRRRVVGVVLILLVNLTGLLLLRRVWR